RDAAQAIAATLDKETRRQGDKEKWKGSGLLVSASPCLEWEGHAMMQPTPPAWVRKRDGSLVPFDPDKISRALFAASESLGRPDAFLARELTDGVVHFLSSENEAAFTTTQ